MSNQRDLNTDPGESMRYLIRIEGQLNPQWADWFGDVTITWDDNGETLITCPDLDQAALHGLLRKVRDLGIPLISVTRVAPDQDDAPPEANP